MKEYSSHFADEELRPRPRSQAQAFVTQSVLRAGAGVGKL